MRFKKTLVALGIAVIVGVGATSAYAWFSAPGTGTGTAGVISSAAITNLVGSAQGPVYPGKESGTEFRITYSNNSGSAVQVGTITATSITTDKVGCDPAWFSVDPVNVSGSMPNGTSSATTTFIKMKDSGTNQDACKGAQLTVALSASGLIASTG